MYDNLEWNMRNRKKKDNGNFRATIFRLIK